MVIVVFILAHQGWALFLRSRAWPQADLTECKGNLKTLATANEEYLEAHRKYPRSLADLTPKHLKALPHCPRAKTIDYRYVSATRPDAYTLCCAGGQHQNAGLDALNYPQYSSFSGLLLP